MDLVSFCARKHVVVADTTYASSDAGFMHVLNMKQPTKRNKSTHTHKTSQRNTVEL